MQGKAIHKVAATLGAALLAALGSPAQAGPQHGVRCPSGYSSDWNSDTKVLKCSKANTTWVETLCPPPPSPFSNYNERDGRDRCTLPNVPYAGNLAPNQYVNAVCSLPGYDYVNDGGSGERDRCRKTATMHAYPNQL